VRPTTQAERSELVRAARSFVDRHLGDRDLSLALVAEELHVSPRHLQRAYASEGTSFSADRLDRRMSRARALLERGESARRVAVNVGYGSGSALAKAFRRKFGILPHTVHPE
jgi:AraC family transcriptional activator of tynA and feaB